MNEPEKNDRNDSTDRAHDTRSGDRPDGAEARRSGIVPDPHPTLELLARARVGEGAARDELIRRYWPRLARWAQGRLPVGARDLYDTGDLVQETMVAALRRLDEFRPDHDGSLQAYLRTAVLNRIRSLARSRRDGKVEVHSGIVDPGPSPLEQAIGVEAVDSYERALERLHADDREAIHLKVELDLPYAEIARQMGKPTILAARKAVSRALYRLAHEMERAASGGRATGDLHA